MKTAEDRLADLLNERDADIDTLKSRISQLEQQLQSAASGWREPRSLAEDMSLPIPRLELQYTPDPELGWSSYTVVYMLVHKHLLGHLSGIPLGSTKIEGGDGQRPDDDHLPFRDGAHAAHDSAHLGLPTYRVVDGVAKRLHFTEWPHQVSLGMQHRREER